jgi:hypothetical protein
MRHRDYEPRVQNRTAHFFEDFSKNFRHIIDVRVGRVLEDKRQEDIGKKMKELFGAIDPLKEYFYDDATNVTLRTLELMAFAYTSVYYASMRFYGEKFPEYIKPMLYILVIEGSYKDSLIRRTVSEEFYRADELYERLQKFSDAISVFKERGKHFQEMIQNFNGNLVAKKELNTTIMETNETLRPILTDIYESANALRGALTYIVMDVGERNPRFVDNLAKIDGNNNARFIGELRRCAEDCTLFVQLFMSAFRDK